MVGTLRCGRSNPGSNPGHGKLFVFDNRLVQYISVHNNKLLSHFRKMHRSAKIQVETSKVDFIAKKPSI